MNMKIEIREVGYRRAKTLRHQRRTAAHTKGNFWIEVWVERGGPGEYVFAGYLHDDCSIRRAMSRTDKRGMHLSCGWYGDYDEAELCVEEFCKQSVMIWEPIQLAEVNAMLWRDAAFMNLLEAIIYVD